MNGLKKAYCRVFQTAFRAALPILPYRDPTILHNLADVPQTLSAKGLRRPLLVTDKSVRTLGLTAPLEQALARAGMSTAVYDGTLPNPTTDMVAEALALYRKNQCDSLIAFGGGSPMDCAKAVGACVARPRKKLQNMAGILRVLFKTPILIAVPTTAGTGSETTLAAVIVDAQTRHKYVINDFALIPSYAVLDPQVVRSLPHGVAAATGMDALTHAVEAYIGRSTTKRTRRDALEATRLIFTNIEAAAAHESVQAEAAMLEASHLAGRAFTRSYVGYIHAVSHSLSGKYDLPHGRTNATLLPLVLELYGKAAHAKLAKLALCANLGTPADGEEALAKAFIKAVYALNEKLGIPATIPDIREADIPQLAAYADREANPLYPVPVLWNAHELVTIYRKVRG